MCSKTSVLKYLKNCIDKIYFFKHFSNYYISSPKSLLDSSINFVFKNDKTDYYKISNFLNGSIKYKYSIFSSIISQV